MLELTPELYKVPLFIARIGVKGNIRRETSAVGVGQVDDPVGGFDPAGGFKFDIAALNDFTGGVVAFKIPG